MQLLSTLRNRFASDDITKMLGKKYAIQVIRGADLLGASTLSSYAKNTNKSNHIQLYFLDQDLMKFFKFVGQVLVLTAKD